MATAEKHATATQEPAAEPVSRGAVATIAPPRLPYHPAIEERFGIDRASWKALVEAVFPLAKTTDSVVLALSYCKARKLDPFKRVVHIVPIYDRDQGREVETVWPGIAEHRTTAFRTKQYAGADACTFGPMVTRAFNGTTKRGAVSANVTFPEWAQLTVYRLIDGQRVPVPGPRVYWLETYSRLGRTEVPNDMWQRRPVGQLEKCAEASALRRAFPEELGGEPTADEIGGEHHGPDNARDVVPAKPPSRADFDASGAAKPPPTRDMDKEYRRALGEVVDDDGVDEAGEEPSGDGEKAPAEDGGGAEPTQAQAPEAAPGAPAAATIDPPPDDPKRWGGWGDAIKLRIAQDITDLAALAELDAAAKPHLDALTAKGNAGASIASAVRRAIAMRRGVLEKAA